MLLLSASCLGAGSMKANFAIWTESGLHKVLKTDPVKPLAPAAIRAARNERESLQIVLRAGRTPLEGVRVVAHDLTSSNKGRISSANVLFYLPAYVFLPKLTASYPDPLPPYKSPFEMKPGQTQPVWVEVRVPPDAKAGEYSGEITVATENGGAVEVAYTLHVYDFVLPTESKLTTAFGLYPEYVADQHGVPRGSNEAKELHKKYYEMLLDRGISTYSIPADLFSDEGAKYLTDPRMTSFVVPYTRDQNEQTRILDRIRSLGAWDKGVFYFLDEPINEKAYGDLKEGCEYLRKIDPKVNIVSPYFGGPDFAKDKTVYDLLTGYVNVWCFNTSFFDSKALDARRRAGDKIWDYVCCGPGRPYANMFVEYAPIEHRMLFWQNYLNQVTGLLYWSTTYWAETKDPWENMATWGGLYGDGSLVYPGKKAGIDGPVSSIRVETIRDGLEDYRYLWMLEKKAGREAVLPYVEKLTESWTEFTRDPALFETVRDEIARRIEAP